MSTIGICGAGKMIYEKLGYFYVINREMSGCFASFKDADHVVPPGMTDNFVLLPDKLILRQFLNEKDICISFATKYDKVYLLHYSPVVYEHKWPLLFLQLCCLFLLYHITRLIPHTNCKRSVPLKLLLFYN